MKKPAPCKTICAATICSQWRTKERRNGLIYIRFSLFGMRWPLLIKFASAVSPRIQAKNYGPLSTRSPHAPYIISRCKRNGPICAICQSKARFGAICIDCIFLPSARRLRNRPSSYSPTVTKKPTAYRSTCNRCCSCSPTRKVCSRNKSTR